MSRSLSCALLLVTLSIVSCQRSSENYGRQHSQQPSYQQPPTYQQQQSFVSSQSYSQPSRVNYAYQQQTVQRQPIATYNNQPSVRPQVSQQGNYYNRPQEQQAQIQQQQQNNYIRPNNNYNQQAPQNVLESRFSDDPSAYQNGDFTTRRTAKPPAPPRPTSPPPTFTANRFGDYFGNRKLSWDKELAQNSEKFALRLLIMLAGSEDENFMISPQSVHDLLVLIAEGASGNTLDQISKTLGLINRDRTRDFHRYSTVALNKSSSDISIRKFSALIGDMNRPVTREYEDIVEKIYDADYIPVNFQKIDEALNEVNNVVYQNTNGQIREAVTRDDLLKAQLILMSGIHFQGNWKSVFNTSFTKQEPFRNIHDTQDIGRVNMMFQRGAFPFAAIRDLGCYFIELPYGVIGGTENQNLNEDRISMIVALPKKGLELVDAIDNINTFGIERVLLELKRAKEEYEDDEVEVHIPRFEVDTSINLVDTLKDMGITDLFDQSTANLSNINKNYYVSSILHKTKVRVDEKGTEASAVTTSIFANKATPPKFHANRPFIYFIVDKLTRLILFTGVYQKPSLF